MTKNVVLIIVDSLYFFCHSRVSLSGIYKIIYYSSVIPAKQLSGNLSNNKHPFFCRCRHCEQSEAIQSLLYLLLSKVFIFCYCQKSLSAIYKNLLFIIVVIPAKSLGRNISSKKLPFCCCRHYERKRSNPLSKITIDCHEKIKIFSRNDKRCRPYHC